MTKKRLITKTDHLNKFLIDEFDSIENGVNLFNKDTITLDMNLNNSTGVLYSLVGYHTSEFIEVKPSTQYYRSGIVSKYICWYDEDFNYISSGNAADSLFTSPAAAKYVRLSMNTSQVDIGQFEEGSSASEYQSYLYVNRFNEHRNNKNKAGGYPGLDNNIKLIDSQINFLKKSKNLFDKSTITDSYYINQLGELVSDSNSFVSDFIEVSGSTDYAVTYTNIKYYSWFDSSKAYVSGGTYTTPITSPSNAKYIRVSGKYAEVHPDDFQFEQASASTYYVPFGYIVIDSPLYQFEAKYNKNRAGGYPGLDALGQIQNSVLPGIDIAKLESAVQTVNIFNEDESEDYVPVQDYRWSNYIAVSEGDIVRRNNGSTKYWGIYNANKAVISETVTGSLEYVVPAGVSFIRSIYDISYLETGYMITVNNEIPVNYTGFGYDVKYINTYSKNDTVWNALLPFKGKKMVALGDSITYGYIPRNSPDNGWPGQLDSFAKLVAKSLYMTFENYGMSGTTVADTGSMTNAFVNRYDNMSDDADLIIVMGGTNDIRKSVPLGTMSDSTVGTFYGALHVLCLGLIEKYHIDQIENNGENKQIVFLTPLKLGTTYGTTYDGKTIQDFGQAVKEVCNYYSIPVFDMESESGINPHIFKTIQGWQDGYTDLYNPYITDGTHPTQAGHQIIANRLVGYLKSIK